MASYLRQSFGAVRPQSNTPILEVSKFNDEDCNHIFSVIDAFIAKRKIQSIL